MVLLVWWPSRPVLPVDAVVVGGCRYTVRGQGQWPLAWAGPGPALKGSGSGQNFDGLARPSWSQGPAHLAWPDRGWPDPTMS